MGLTGWVRNVWMAASKRSLKERRRLCSAQSIGAMLALPSARIDQSRSTTGTHRRVQPFSYYLVEGGLMERLKQMMIDATMMCLQLCGNMPAATRKPLAIRPP